MTMRAEHSYMVAITAVEHWNRTSKNRFPKNVLPNFRNSYKTLYWGREAGLIQTFSECPSILWGVLTPFFRKLSMVSE